ncbi:Mth938-like domain-containing protein [Phaeovulum sp.]|uniref:Mth938-like domain-containing protein n=1 Tax=Phaeovulum sp. TaxID=2934796 RepID=UPI003563C982
MQFPEADFGEGLPIDSIGPGFFRVAGLLVHGPLVICAEKATPWVGFTDSAAITALAGRVDLVVLGTGASITALPAALKVELMQAGLMYEVMATAIAARSYNHLLAEGRRVAAALLPLPEAEA